jgi:hypothetical protein
MKNLLLAASFVLSVSSALAQNAPNVGHVEDIKGNVSIVQEGKFLNVTNDTKFEDGARIVAGAGSSVTIELDKGCEIKLKPGQALVINKALHCDKLAAAVQTLSLVAAGESAGPLGLNGAQLAAFAGIGLIAYQLSLSPR